MSYISTGLIVLGLTALIITALPYSLPLAWVALKIWRTS